MAPGGKAKGEAKRQRRQAALAARHEEQRRLQARQRKRSLAIYGGIALIVIAGVGMLAWTTVLRPGARAGIGASTAAGVAGTGGPAAARPTVQEFPDQGVAHIALGQAHPPYNSNPPTSGWHTPQTVPWGVHRQVIPDEILVHNLEHGGIWISYKDPSDAALVERLEALVRRYRSKVVITPRPANDSRIAVAAWTRLLKLEAFDEKSIVDFINAYKDKGPERVPD